MNLLLLIPIGLFVAIASIGFSMMIFNNDYDKWYLHYFLGLPVSSTVMIVASILFQNPINIIVTFVIFLYGFMSFYKEYVPKISKNALKDKPDGTLHKVLAVVVFVILLITFLHSLLPPTGWDENVYHIPAAKEIALGKIKFPLLVDSGFHNFYPPFSTAYGNLPYASETVGAFVYAITGATASLSYLQFINFLVLLFALFFLSKEIFKTNTTVFLSFILLLTVTRAILVLLSTSYVDILVAACQILSITTLLHALKSITSRYILYSLVIFGFSLSLKYPAMFFAPVYSVLFFYVVINLRKRKDIVGIIVKGAVFNLLFSSIWYIKNLILYNNPFYPFYIFTSPPTERMSEIELLTRTQLAPRFSLDLQGLIKTLTVYYQYDKFLFFAFLVVGLYAIYKLFKSRKKSYVTVFLLSAISLYLINFMFGNQVARYVVFVPIVIIFLFSITFSKYKLILIAVLFFSLLRFPTHYIKEIYVKRIVNIGNFLTNDDANYYRDNIGCLYDTVSWIGQTELGGQSTINLWDPYAAVYYSDESYFKHYSKLMPYSKEEVSKDIKFVYINEMHKTSFMNNLEFHSGIKPLDRAKLEEELLIDSQIVYSNGNCKLYKLAYGD